MERERAKTLEGRAVAAHVGCCDVVVLDCGLWCRVPQLYPFCRVQYPTRPNPSADLAPISVHHLMLTHAHEDQGRLNYLHAQWIIQW